MPSNEAGNIEKGVNLGEGIMIPVWMFHGFCRFAVFLMHPGGDA